MVLALDASSLYRFFHAGEEETLALQGVSLSVGGGEVVAVVGPSGSGKSTLLACLAGLDEPDGGRVLIEGERLSRRPEPERAALRARRIGVLFQSGNLLDHLTVAENVELAQRIAGPSNLAGAAALLESLGLARRAHARPAELSGGETARAGLAVALANDPAVVLADEPTGELDSASEARVLDLLWARAAAGGAVVVASHSPAV
ncbi:MAG TPA: ATP-binding cassette domain-containing protein, partial [Actinomycetes bacterium]|nr:ATP-binding cassette domain-containing protein [Actinomycetes bacterium]